MCAEGFVLATPPVGLRRLEDLSERVYMPSKEREAFFSSFRSLYDSKKVFLHHVELRRRQRREGGADHSV